MSRPGDEASAAGREAAMLAADEQRPRERSAPVARGEKEGAGRGGGQASRKLHGALGASGLFALAIPFGILALRLVTWSKPVHLPDDLALVDLHTRLALGWHQQLGPFDRFGWNHPGPAWYYLLAVFYRLAGARASSAFFAAAVVNALALLGTVSVLWKRAGALAAAWSALSVGVLALALSFTGPASITYSESALGALASPWNATIVVLPLVFLLTLAALVADGSLLGFIGELLVATFVVQTDISTLPLVAVVVLSSLVIFGAGRLHARRRPGGADRGAGHPAPGGSRHRSLRKVALVALLAGFLLLAWVPPLSQQLDGHPGNMTLIWRFFTSSHRGTSYRASFWSLASAESVLFSGPRAVMSEPFYGPSTHAVVALVLTCLVVVTGLVLAWRRRQLLGGSLVLIAAAGLLASLVAVTHVTGLLAGYLVLWEAAVPAAALAGLGISAVGPSGAVGSGARPTGRGVAGARRAAGRGPLLLTAGTAGLLVLLAASLSYRAAAIPSLGAASNPTVTRLAQMVHSHLRPDGRPLFVGDNGLDLVGTEEFIGLVDELDTDGYEPRVSPFWRVQFGSRYLGNGRERRQVELWPASSHPARLPGYVGSVGGVGLQIISPK